MKKLIIVICVLAIVTACQEKEVRYTQQSSEIEVVKQHIKNYNAKSYDVSIMVDTCKSFLNSKTEPVLRDDLIAYHETNDANYSKRGFLEKDQEYEMVVTDDGETWVNCWLDWQGTIAATGKVIDIPVHLTYRFIDGKIVRELGYWDPTDVVLEMQAVAEMANSTTEEE